MSEIVYRYILCAVIVRFTLSTAPSHGVLNTEPERLLKKESEVNVSDLAYFSQELNENDLVKTTKNILFWIQAETTTTKGAWLQQEYSSLSTTKKSDNFVTEYEALQSQSLDQNAKSNDTTPSAVEHKPTQANELDSDNESSNTVLQVPPEFLPKIDEEIMLQRNNCNLEIWVDEAHDTRIQVKFESLRNNSVGKCCVTLNGNENVMLALLLTDIHLQNDLRNKFLGEVIKVVVTNDGNDFIIKEYHKDEYQPLLLTETHRAYITLYYNVTMVKANSESTRFNLEAFTYRKRRNNIPQHDSSYSHRNTPSMNQNDNEKVFITTEKTSFFNFL